MTTAMQTERSSSPASLGTSSEQWVVQDILAERSSATGGNEVLVVWKASWIPVANLEKSGDVWHTWKRTRKWTTSSMMMQVMLPIEPGTQLQKDCDYVSMARATEVMRRAQNANQLINTWPASRATGPRKQLGTTARKRRPDSTPESHGSADN